MEEKDTLIICPNCLREMDISEAVKGEGDNAQFICPFCNEVGNGPLN